MKEECKSHLSITVTSVLRDTHKISISFLPSDELQPFYKSLFIFFIGYYILCNCSVNPVIAV